MNKIIEINYLFFFLVNNQFDIAFVGAAIDSRTSPGGSTLCARSYAGHMPVTHKSDALCASPRSSGSPGMCSEVDH